MTSFVYSVIIISAIFLWIICAAIAFIIIGCAIIFANRVTQQVHYKSEIITNKTKNEKPKRTIIGPFNTFDEFMEYIETNYVDPHQIAVVNIDGVAKAFQVCTTSDNITMAEEVLVDWDEITYQLSIENARDM